MDKKTNRKDRGYFDVDEDEAFSIVAKLKNNKDLQVDMVTCREIRITWQTKKYTREDIQGMI